MKEWSNIISDLAHDLILGDDEDFQISSIKPQVLDGNTWIENAMGISEEYFSNRLPKVTQEEYEKSIHKIFSYQIK